jgi:hypothetical protein
MTATRKIRRAVAIGAAATTAVAPRSSSSSTSEGWMPGSCFVPVSFQSHALAPPGKSLASLKGPSTPSTSRRPQERWVTLGERASCSIVRFLSLELTTTRPLQDSERSARRRSG